MVHKLSTLDTVQRFKLVNVQNLFKTKKSKQKKSKVQNKEIKSSKQRNQKVQNKEIRKFKTCSNRKFKYSENSAGVYVSVVKH